MDTQLLEATLDYTNLCASNNTDPTEWENQCLSAGAEFLPAVAATVLADRDTATAEYFGWLADQLEAR